MLPPDLGMWPNRKPRKHAVSRRGATAAPGRRSQQSERHRGESMARDLSGKRIAILATDGVERVELEQPRGALYGAGAETELLSIHPGEIQARQFDLVPAGTFPGHQLSPG